MRENKFGGAVNWQQAYTYDRWGNRTIDQTNTWGSGIPKPNFGVDTSKNRLTAPGGYTMSYDSAGNLTFDNSDGIGGTRTYDAENRIKQAWSNSQWQTYTYDGDGKRVKRNVNGTETWQVYGIGGELLAEYATNASPSSPQKEYGYRNGQLLVTAEPSAQIHWLVTDQLGPPRMIFDQSGSLANVSRHDYLPFGEELSAGIDGRLTTQGYVGDSARQKFTQKERDIETGLDYFGVRYYASMQGRFTGADAFWKDSHLADPQSWNKYAYARNNPLKYVDPSGEKADVEIETDEKHKTGTIKIKASFAIWTGKNGVSAKQLERAKDTIKARIEKVWSGSYQQNGITYTVSTTVDVQVKGSESEATNTGAQNVVEITNGAVGDGADSVTGGHVWGPDTGRWNYGNLSDTAAHEFGHLLGVDDHDGLVLMNTNHLNEPLIPHAAATAYDYGWALGGAINSHRSESRSYVSNGDSQETRSSPMFRLGPPENHRSNTELRAGRLWWN